VAKKGYCHSRIDFTAYQGGPGHPETTRVHTWKAREPDTTGIAQRACGKLRAENENNLRAKAKIFCLRDSGMRWTAIADRLNRTGLKTSRGKHFRAEQIKRLYFRKFKPFQCFPQGTSVL
jgi:hypothetical protein